MKLCERIQVMQTV